MVDIIESYFDDSGDEKKERFCATGGFFGTSTQWDAYDMAWSNATHELKEPFHAADCEGGRDGGYGQFSDWSFEKRVSLMTNLVTVIKTARLAGFASIVPIQDYKIAFPNCAEDDPYRLTIPHTIMNMAFIADDWDRDVHVWFELGGPKGFTVETFDAIQKLNWLPTRRLRGISFDYKTLRQLQSADILAREAFKHIDNLGVRDTRIPIKRLGEYVFFIVWTDAALKYLAQHGGPQNLELLAHWDQTPDAPKLKWHSLWLAKRGKK